MATKTTDMEFWRNAYDEHAPALYGFLRKRVKSREDAEDLLQDVFIRVIKADTELRDPNRVKSYLFSTAYHLSINSYRQHRFANLPVPGENGENPLEQVQDHGGLQPDDEAEWMDLNEQVLASLNTLNERYKTAFRYGVLEARAYSEIARLTGWTTAQVKVNVHRARKAMIDLLRQRGVLEAQE